MDILGWIQNNAAGLIISTGISVGGGFIVFGVGKYFIDLAKDFFITFVSDLINSKFKNEEDRELAKTAVHWIEVKFPDTPGHEKHRMALDILTQKGIQKSAADNLIIYAVSAMNDTLKEIQNRIKTD